MFLLFKASYLTYNPRILSTLFEFNKEMNEYIFNNLSINLYLNWNYKLNSYISCTSAECGYGLCTLLTDKSKIIIDMLDLHNITLERKM